MVYNTNTTKAIKITDKIDKNKKVNNKVGKIDKVDKVTEVEKVSKSETKPTRRMASPRARGRARRINSTPTRSSPRIVRRSASYPNAVNRHFVDSIPILEITLRFDEDEYDVWRRQDTDEVNLYYLLRIKYPRDEDESTWLQELEKLKKEIKDVRIIEEGWFEGVCVVFSYVVYYFSYFRLLDNSLIEGSLLNEDIAQKYNIYEHVAALLESENSWFDTPKKQHNPKIKSERGTASQPETPEVQTNGSSTTRSVPSSRHVNNLPNGNTKTEAEPKIQRRTSPRLAYRSQAKPESSKRLRDDESERENIKEEVQSLKRKLDQTEEKYLNYSGSNKRRAVWAGIGAAVGAGVAAVALNSMGIGVSDIASGIGDLTSKWF
ncbi:9251_t:CDS:2 [Acaulospora morrowiae]|uniref:9251_t:CDS:1 n=1 Tax=Acaulospora morrowiae TaxID=94023 RepID=A0A9N8ZJL7_9GLOM|nr:9251_t:CDS:2 [Acaulospora morrowiae]